MCMCVCMSARVLVVCCLINMQILSIYTRNVVCYESMSQMSMCNYASVSLAREILERSRLRAHRN